MKVCFPRNKKILTKKKKRRYKTALGIGRVPCVDAPWVGQFFGRKNRKCGKCEWWRSLAGCLTDCNVLCRKRNPHSLEHLCGGCCGVGWLAGRIWWSINIIYSVRDFDCHCLRMIAGWLAADGDIVVRVFLGKTRKNVSDVHHSTRSLWAHLRSKEPPNYRSISS